MGRDRIMANFVSRRTFVIEWGLCDPAGIVFNSRFFEMFDQATWLLFERALVVPRAELFASPVEPATEGRLRETEPTCRSVVAQTQDTAEDQRRAERF